MDSTALQLEEEIRPLRIIGKDELEAQFPDVHERNRFIRTISEELQGKADSATVMRLNYELTVVKIEDEDKVTSRLYRRDGRFVELLGTNATEDAARMLTVIRQAQAEAPKFHDNYGKYVKTVPDFIIPGKTLKMIQDYIYSDVNVLLKGGPGTGKTELPQKIAKALRMDCLIVDCGTIKTPQDWFGTREYVEGQGTTYIPSELLERLQKPGFVVLDEFNRTTPDCHNSIFRILDGNRQVHILPLKKTITVHPHCIIMATMNEGRSHTGTYMMDSAITDRFEEFTLEIPTEAQIVKLLSKRFPIVNRSYMEALAKLTHKLKDLYLGEDVNVQIGLRPALNACKLIARNNKFIDVLDQAFAGRFSSEGGSDSEQTTVRQAYTGLITKELLNSKNNELQHSDNIYGDDEEFENEEYVD